LKKPEVTSSCQALLQGSGSQPVTQKPLVKQLQPAKRPGLQWSRAPEKPPVKAKAALLLPLHL
jgi:hypothetical protein